MSGCALGRMFWNQTGVVPSMGTVPKACLKHPTHRYTEGPHRGIVSKGHAGSWARETSVSLPVTGDIGDKWVFPPDTLTAPAQDACGECVDPVPAPRGAHETAVASVPNRV